MPDDRSRLTKRLAGAAPRGRDAFIAPDEPEAQEMERPIPQPARGKRDTVNGRKEEKPTETVVVKRTGYEVTHQRFTLHVPKDLVKRIDRASKRVGLSKSQMGVQAWTGYLDELEEAFATKERI